MDVIKRGAPENCDGNRNQSKEKKCGKKIDPKKLVLYSEIMKPKFDD